MHSMSFVVIGLVLSGLALGFQQPPAQQDGVAPLLDSTWQRRQKHLAQLHNAPPAHRRRRLPSLSRSKC